MEVSSAPYLLDPTQFGLGDIKKNQKKLAELKQKFKAKELPVWQGAQLTEYLVGPDESFIVLEAERGEGPEIAYLVHLKLERLKALPSQSVTQVEVWNNPARSSTTPFGVTKHVFFDILLKRHKYIVSDQSQTPSGRDFWFRRLDEADAKGCRVGVMLDDEVTWKGSETFGMWMRVTETSAWGTDNIHHDTRLVIERP